MTEFERSPARERNFIRRSKQDGIADAFMRNYKLSDAGRRFLPNPKGFYVYLLQGKRGILYVGKSANIFQRLGEHMSDSLKRDAVNKVRVFKCKDKAHMDWLEKEAIRFCDPEWNEVRYIGAIDVGR